MQNRNSKKLILLISCFALTVVLACSATFGWFIRNRGANVFLGFDVLKYEMKITHEKKDGEIIELKPNAGRYEVFVKDFDNEVRSGYPSGDDMGIYPGSKGVYNFTIHNTGEIPVNYSIKFSDTDIFPNNMDLTLKKDGAGDYQPIQDLNGYLTSGNSQTFYIKYDWPYETHIDQSTDSSYDQNDTSYILDSNNNGQTKTLKMDIKFEQA